MADDIKPGEINLKGWRASFVTSDDPSPQTRYFRLERAGSTGWRVLREVDLWSWYLAKL